MQITHKIEYADGPFDTSIGKLSCVPKNKDKTVSLCFDAGWHITFAKIKLYTRDRFVDAEATFDSASKLGKEIVHRWNSHTELKEALTPALPHLCTLHARHKHRDIGNQELEKLITLSTQLTTTPTSNADGAPPTENCQLETGNSTDGTEVNLG